VVGELPQNIGGGGDNTTCEEHFGEQILLEGL
jgi:hypothetical protein